MRKIRLKLILLQTLSLIFLIAGVQRLYIATQAEKYEAIGASDWEMFETLTSQTVGEFLFNETLWALVGLLFGITFIGYVNWRNKKSLLNTLLIFSIVLILFQIGLFNGGLFNNYINTFWGAMGINFTITFIIAGIVFGLLSAILIITSLKIKNRKSTIHNSG